MRYLLEIGCEELPFFFASKAHIDIKEALLEKIRGSFSEADALRIENELQSYSTPRIGSTSRGLATKRILNFTESAATPTGTGTTTRSG